MCDATLCESPARFLVIVNTRSGQRSNVQSDVCGQHLNSYVREFCKTPQGVTVLPLSPGLRPKI